MSGVLNSDFIFLHRSSRIGNHSGQQKTVAVGSKISSPLFTFPLIYKRGGGHQTRVASIVPGPGLPDLRVSVDL